MQLKVLAIVLAGGEGTRLYPLTKERAKPAVPFGGKYRIVDFVLSNLVNSGIYSIYVVIQFRSQSLLQHLSDGWNFGGILKNEFIVPVPAQMRSSGKNWYHVGPQAARLPDPGGHLEQSVDAVELRLAPQTRVHRVRVGAPVLDEGVAVGVPDHAERRLDAARRVLGDQAP